MNLFDIWFISIILSVITNIVLIALLLNKTSELNEMKDSQWKKHKNTA